jgi:hypothetical protein
MKPRLVMYGDKLYHRGYVPPNPDDVFVFPDDNDLERVLRLNHRLGRTQSTVFVRPAGRPLESPGWRFQANLSPEWFSEIVSPSVTRHAGTRSVRTTALRLTSRRLDMQQRLFGPNLRDLASVSDARLWRVLSDLRAASVLQCFRIWLVGSRLEPGMTGSDVDLVLSPRPGPLPSEQLVEQALWHCRDYGLYGTTPRCVIDPCFRQAGPTVALVPLRPQVRIQTVKLLSPRLADLVMQGHIREWRSVGDVALEFVRRAEETDYFAKVPRASFDGSRWPYLRPAVEIAGGREPGNRCRRTRCLT